MQHHLLEVSFCSILPCNSLRKDEATACQLHPMHAWPLSWHGLLMFARHCALDLIQQLLCCPKQMPCCSCSMNLAWHATLECVTQTNTISLLAIFRQQPESYVIMRHSQHVRLPSLLFIDLLCGLTAEIRSTMACASSSPASLGCWWVPSIGGWAKTGEEHAFGRHAG